MYAIQIMFDGKWLYVMKEDGEEVMTFDDHYAAQTIANIWEKPEREEFVKVVEYRAAA
jgi:hypothetical protein